MEDKKNEIIDLGRLTQEIRSHFPSLLIITLVTTILGTASSYMFKKQFTSEAKLMPAEAYDSNSGLSSALNLAPILGNEQNPELTTSLEILMTKDFFEELYKNESIKKDIDTRNRNFISTLLFGSNQETSFDAAYRFFYSNRIGVNFNDKKQILTLSLTHPSPNSARELLAVFLKEFNKYSKSRDVTKASRSVDLIKNEIYKTQSPELKLVLSNYLIQDLRKIQLSEISEEYIFELIESPRIPERKSSPNRVLFLFISFFVGLFFSFLFLISRRKD